MKRRITAILLLVLLVGALFALVACNAEVDKDDECKHNMVPDTETLVEPTCEKDGSVVMRCTKCDEKQKEVIPALAHADKHEVAREASTCKEQGYVMYECNYCGEAFKEDLPIGSHTETAYPEVEPGCIEPGYTGGKYCSVCDEVIVARTEIPASGAHKPTPFMRIRSFLRRPAATPHPPLRGTFSSRRRLWVRCASER